MKRKVKVSADLYPSDKDLTDLVMSGTVSGMKVQEFLRDKGIFTRSRSTKLLAKMLASLFLDNKEIENLMLATNSRENRTKTTLIELNLNGAKPEDVFTALQGIQIPSEDSKSLVRIDEFKKPEFNSEAGEITFVQPFKKIDFSKTHLLQEERNELSLTIREESANTYKITYSSSNVAGDFFLGKIKEQMLANLQAANPKLDPSFIEIYAPEIPIEEINKFFFNLINSPYLSPLTLRHVAAVQMTKGEALQGKESEDGDTDVSNMHVAGPTIDEPELKNLRFEGRQLLSHPDVKQKFEQGYLIRSLDAVFKTSDEISTESTFTVGLGFGSNNKFISEVKTYEVETFGEVAKEKRSLSLEERETKLSRINATAFALFDAVRKQIK